MNFELELSQGNFYIPECTKCMKVVWPPSEFCNHCFGKVLLEKKAYEGKIIEFSNQSDAYFCLVEFEKEIRVIAKISKMPKIDQKVKILECGLIDGNYFFHVI